ncbi:MAG: cation:proton antiporter, partial [Alphaproteobacteria bacterium]
MPDHTQLTAIAVVGLAALICGLILTRMRQPAVVGYILAGIILGPSAAGVVEDRTQINTLA